MDDRETLIRFLEAHYNDRERSLLGQRAGLAALVGEISTEMLMRLTEREGLAASLLLRIEQDYPNILPPLTWAGATVTRTLPRSELPRDPEPAPVPTLTMQTTPVPAPRPLPPPPLPDLTRPDVPPRPALNAAQSAPIAAAPPPPAAPSSSSPAAPPPAALPAAPLEKDVSGRPYRFAHGYTLPPHWAKRDRETAEIVNEIFSDKYPILALVAIGGTGKSALTRKLLDELPDFQIPMDGALWFSFYNEPDFDRFLVEACRYVIPDFDAQAHPSPYEKSVMLREAMQKKRYLMVLDGLEVLQVADRERKNYGSFQDRALREFMEAFGAETRSQLLVSTRFRLTDLEGKPYYYELPLGNLSLDSADDLLNSYGIEGSRLEFEPIYARFGAHALTLQILGDYLTRYHGGDIAAVAKIEAFPVDAAQGIRLQAVLNAVWQELNPRERFFLTRLAAFRGGVDERSLVILNRESDHADAEFRALAQRLLAGPLVDIERRDGHARLTAHPLIKTFFYERMADSERDQTHRELKDFAQGLPLPDRPRTLEDYEPLLQACHHCLQVGLYTEAYQVYRRNNMDNCLRWWGHYAQAESLLEPLREASQGTSPSWQSERWQKSWVENETALLALLRGDVPLAIERFRHSAQMDAQYGDALGESASLQNLAGALIQRGDFEGALRDLEQSRLLENAQQRFEKEDILTGLEGICRAEMGHLPTGLALLQKAGAFSAQKNNARALCYWTWRIAEILLRGGQKDAAKQRFEEALKLAEREPYRDYIGYALSGLCRTLTESGEIAEARARGTEALRLARTLGNPFLENEAALALARVAEAERNLPEAQGLARQALTRAEECGYDAQATEAHLLLARAAQNPDDSRQHIAAAQILLAKTHHAATKKQLDALLQSL